MKYFILLNHKVYINGSSRKGFDTLLTLYMSIYSFSIVGKWKVGEGIPIEIALICNAEIVAITKDRS